MFHDKEKAIDTYYLCLRDVQYLRDASKDRDDLIYQTALPHHYDCSSEKANEEKSEPLPSPVLIEFKINFKTVGNAYSLSHNALGQWDFRHGCTRRRT